MTLAEYVSIHTKRGECKCGKCLDAYEGPEPKPGPHTVNMIFFQASPTDKAADIDEFRRLTAKHVSHFSPDTNPLDGEEHSYIELGAWIGDQGVALQYMALGVMLNVFKLLTPETVLGLPADNPLCMTMAERGLVCIKRAPSSL